MKRKLLILVFLLLVSLPIIHPFLQRGYFPTHDGEWAVVRLAEMHRELRSFQIPPRWAGYLNHGYGYPLFQFTYPGPYLIAEFFNLIGFGLTESMKILFSLTVIFSGLFMFLLGKKLWGTAGGLVSSTLYLYAPYRLTNLFVRGSIGESLVFVLMPLLFWIFLLQSEKPDRRFTLFSSLGLALLLISHNVLSLLFLPVLFIFCVNIYFSKKNKQSLFGFIFSWALGFGLSAWFWLPALAEKQFIRLSIIPLANRMAHFVTLNELLSNNWSFGIRPPLQIGWLHFILGLMSLGLIGYDYFKSKKFDFPKILGLILIVSFSLLFSNSNYFWELPLFSQIDFPWRMLGVVMFLSALVGGILIRGKYKNAITVLVILGAMMINYKFISTEERIYRDDDYYSTNDATTTSANELMPVWVRQDPQSRPVNRISSYDNNWLITFEKNNDTQVKFTSFFRDNKDLTINTIFFPGWRGYLDEKPIRLIPNDQGLMDISITEGKHEILLKYVRTPIRWVADMITLISLLALTTTMYRYIVIEKKIVK